MASVTVTGGEQFRDLSRRLSAAGSGGKVLRKSMRSSIVAAVEPMKTAVQQAILEIPSKGHEGPSLRAQMVKATRVRVVASGGTALVRLEVAGSRMPEGRENLPAYMDGEMSPWRHPAYGHRERKWAEQSAHPYFARTVRPLLPGVRRAVQAAVRETAAQL